MGLFDKFKKASAPVPEAVSVTPEPLVVYSPVPGRCVPVAEVPDPVFSGGMLGMGVGVWPTAEVVFSPASGTVTVTTPTRHAIGIATDEGMEVLVHVGMDTVDMNGKGFSYLVSAGDKVKAGQPLLTFSRAAIKEEGHDDVVVCVVTNTDEYGGVEVLVTGDVDAGRPVVRAAEK
jgi:glucose-specific phosphotransferase system IIA component